MTKQLSILCFGAGAIGSYVGGSLAAKGHNIVFFDRPETILKIKSNGIHVKPAVGPKIDLDNPKLTSDLNAILNKIKFDFSIMAVKSYDTDELLLQWDGISGKIPPVLCLQNGVENESKIGSLIGEDNIIAGTVTTAIGKKDDGTIIVEKLRGIGISGNLTLSKIIIDAANEAGLNAIYYADKKNMKWSKLLTNLTANASSAILNMTPGEILDNKKLYDLEIEQLRETLRVMESMAIRVCDLPGTPVKLFAFLVRHIPTFLSKKILTKAMASGRGAKMPSFYIDLMSGRKKSEVEFLNGAVVRFGAANGVDTPVNRFLTKTLIEITKGILPQSMFEKDPDKLVIALTGYH
jgi:2-dehydropantoate 2-reductase